MPRPAPNPDALRAIATRGRSDPADDPTDPEATPMNPTMVTTGLEIPGCRITQNLGVVRGITVRSRSALGNLAGGIQALFGGNITIYTELCEHARKEAFDLMVQHGGEMRANAIIGMHYDANEVMEGVTEVLAYGTAVVIEKAS